MLFGSVAIGGNDGAVGFTTSFSDAVLVYRASQDGFDPSTYHRKCRGSNTLFVFKTTSNYVFGGFIRESINKTDQYINDQNAFMFSMRRNGATNFNILRVDGTKTGNDGSQYSFYRGSTYGPTFGGGHDLYISNAGTGGYSNFCYSYECPGNYY